MLKVQDLTFSYTKDRNFQFPDMECQAGEKWLIIGQSGCGKTTLLNLLAGLRTPQSGSIEIDKVRINDLKSAAMDTFRGQNIGIIFQQAHFVRSLRVFENLALAQKLSGIPIDKARIQELLNRLNIGDKYAARTSDLSVGEQQRVAIARALINQPKILLADEPTSALDDTNTQEVISLLEEQAQVAKAILLVVTHDNRLKERFPKQINL